MIYFDNAATTFPKPKEVYEEMDSLYKKYGVNAGRGAYENSNKLSDIIDETRELIKSITGLKQNYQVILNSSATESINLILKGLNWKPNDVICYSPFEHNATLRTLYYLEKEYKLNLIKIPFNPITLELEGNNFVDVLNRRNVKLVAVSHVTNVLGTELSLKKIIDLKNRFGFKIIVDGAQAAGLLVPPGGIDYYVFAGHKTLYGPMGIGGFLINDNASMPRPLLHGGTGTQSELKTMPAKLPFRYEAGSPNILSIVGLNTALKWIKSTGIEKIYDRKTKLTCKLKEILNSYIETKLFLPQKDGNNIGIISAKFSGYSPNEIGKILDENFDIAVRTGLHCAPETHEFLGSFPEGLVRFSLSYFNTEEELDYLKESLDSFLL